MVKKALKTPDNNNEVRNYFTSLNPNNPSFKSWMRGGMCDLTYAT
jgi:hypothetical protein